MGVAVSLELIGRYQASIWEAADGSALIASVLDEGGERRTVKGPCGAGPRLQSGLGYRFHGQWERHEKYGRQFCFSFYTAILPHDQRGVIAYLTSIAEGIGEKRATKLWDSYGERAVEILRADPERVASEGILSAETAREASQSLREESAFEGTKIGLLTLFAGRGFQAGKLIKECLRLWGSRAAERIRRNPYVLLLKKLPSAGFKRCDRLYLDLGLPPARLKRQALCAWHAIASDSSGHTWHDGKFVARALMEAISGSEPLASLRLAVRSRLLAKHRDSKSVWLAEWRKAHHEAIVADKVREMIVDD